MPRSILSISRHSRSSQHLAEQLLELAVQRRRPDRLSIARQIGGHFSHPAQTVAISLPDSIGASPTPRDIRIPDLAPP